MQHKSKESYIEIVLSPFTNVVHTKLQTNTETSNEQHITASRISTPTQASATTEKAKTKKTTIDSFNTHLKFDTVTISQKCIPNAKDYFVKKNIIT